jgi:hypothetical protein
MCLAGNQDNVSRVEQDNVSEWSGIMSQSGVMSKVRLAGNQDNVSEWSRIMCQSGAG